MKKLFLHLFILALISFIIINVYNILATKASLKYYGAATADQINMSFKNSINKEYNCYFLGNSRIYRDINPDLFQSVNAYNFGHDNDSFNQMYYKLLYLLEHGRKIDYLIIGTDYFQFSFLSDTRNYIYSKLFHKEYSDDFTNKSFIEKAENSITNTWINKQNVLRLCIKYILRINPAQIVNYQKDNGQYIVYGDANPNDKIDRSYTILNIQYNYFIKIIRLCEKEKIQMYVIMPPLWHGETDSHSDLEREKFDNMIKQALSGTPYSNNYINYLQEKGLAPYTDFIDITHLKPQAADKFSNYINERIFGNQK